MILSEKDYVLMHERLRKAREGDKNNDQEEVLYWLDMTKQYIQLMVEKVAATKC